MRLLPLLMILVIPAPGIAQRTYVVDVQNRPGTHFTDLGAAFAAVQHGDIVLVRTGPNGTPVPAPAMPLMKGISLMGYPHPYSSNGEFGSEAGPIGGVLRVRGIPAGQRLQIKSITGRGLPGSPGTGTLVIESCQGQVLIDAVSIGAEFYDCADVTVCRQSFLYNVKVTRSRVRVNESFVRGLAPSPAMVAVDSEITLGGSANIVGGDGYLDQNTCRVLYDPTEGVVTTDSTFILSKYCTIYGGGIYYPFPHPCNVVIGRPALKAAGPFGATLVADPEARLGPTEGVFRIYTRAIPGVAGVLGSPGKPENEFELVTISHQGARVWVFASLPGRMTVLGLAGMGATWLDPATTIFVGSGVGDGEGLWRSPTYRFPPLPNAVPVLFQVVAEGPAGLELSVPALFVYQHGLR